MPAIFLIGFMASGKSQVAKLLASHLDMPCVDLDTHIEESAGLSVAEIFATEGEAGFREREARALHEVSARGAVIATGGGTPCFGDNLESMKHAGTVVHLATELPTALARAAVTPGTRPLLQQEPQEIERLYRERAPIYRRAQVSVSTEHKSAQQVATDVQAALHCTDTLPDTARASSIVALGERSYPIVVQGNSLGHLGASVRARLAKAKTAAIVSDQNVFPLYGKVVTTSLENAGFRVVHALVEPGEKSKEISVFSELSESLIAHGLDRSSVVVALGGGVVGDLAGFVAASLFRGISVVQVPTTLLAMTDSSVGGKTGINSQNGKNLLGAFWQPSLVWADPWTLVTLSQRERRAAFGELVKYALLDSSLWNAVQSMAPVICSARLQPNDGVASLVRACAGLKAAIVSADERESGLRATLNLGHTVGHAIETHAGYGHLLHGEAVALGLLAACRVSYRLGLCEQALEQKVAAILKAAGLATDLDRWLRADVLARMNVDKKRTGSSVRFITVAKPGDVRRQEIELSELTGLLLKD